MGQRIYYWVFKNNFVYSLSLILSHFIKLLLKPFPLCWQFSFGALVGDLWYFFDFVNRDLCRREMALALGPTHSVRVRQRALRLSMRNSVAYLFEAYFSSSLSREELLDLVRNRDWARPLQKALEAGKGAIVLIAHFSNMTLVGYLIAAHGHASCIAKYQRVYNKLMVSHRKKMDGDTLNEFETSYHLLLRLLRRNEIIVATIDRGLKRVKGVYTPFFGHTIIAPYYPVDIARLSDAPIFIALLTRNRCRCDMHFEGPIHVPADMDTRESREKYTRQIFSVLEKYIAAYPHEWQWHFKRFTKKHWGVPRYEVSP